MLLIIKTYNMQLFNVFKQCYKTFQIFLHKDITHTILLTGIPITIFFYYFKVITINVFELAIPFLFSGNNFFCVKFYYYRYFSSKTVGDITTEEESIYDENYLKPADPNNSFKKKVKKRINIKKDSQISLYHKEIEADINKSSLRIFLKVANTQVGIGHKMQRMNQTVLRAQRFDMTMRELKKEHEPLVRTLIDLNMPLHTALIEQHLSRMKQYEVDFINHVTTLDVQSNINTVLISNLFARNEIFIKALRESLIVSIADFVRLLMTKKGSLEKKLLTKFKKIVKRRKVRDFYSIKVPVMDEPEFIAYETSFEKIRNFKFSNSDNRVHYELVHRFYKDPLDYIQQVNLHIYDALTQNTIKIKTDIIHSLDSVFIDKHQESIKNKIDDIYSIESEIILNELAALNTLVYKNIAETLNKFQFNLYLARKTQIENCRQNILFAPPKITPEEKRKEKELLRSEAQHKKLVQKEEKLRQKLLAKAAKVSPRQKAKQIQRLEEAIAKALASVSPPLEDN